jgi:hypothetical protein
MALLDSEIERVRYELGFNLLNAGAEPYIGVHAVFEQVIQVYLRAGATTTSSTAVTAATTATPVAITLASATGFAAGARIVLDVDGRQEMATIQSLAGAVVTVLLTKAHTGTYPVTVEGGETIVRSILAELRNVQDKILAAAGAAGLKRAEDIEWFQGNNGVGSLSLTLGEMRNYYRDELASALGVENLHRAKRYASQSSVLW